MNPEIIKEAVEKCGTAAYIFDLDILKEEVGKVKEYLNNVNATACYAMKANPFLVKEMDEYIEKFEVCSPGEYEICAKYGINPEKIVVSGVNKSKESMERIFDLSEGKCVYTAESKLHFEILSEEAKKRNIKIKLLPRLTSGNQFGMDKSDLEDVLGLAAGNEYVEIIGIHYFSGTQKKLKKIEKEISELSEYFKYLEEKFGLHNLELEYGPGLSVFYFENDKQPDWEEQIREFSLILNEYRESFGNITVEMGRFLACHCGYYITKVVDIKRNKNENYIIVDGGIHQINYFGQMLGMKIPFMEHYSKDCLLKPKSSLDVEKWNIFGSLCTTNDVIVREKELTNPSISDILLFRNAGAYSVTEGISLFLSRDLPAVCTYSKENAIKILRPRTEINGLNS